jgi:hypothetical protein
LPDAASPLSSSTVVHPDDILPNNTTFVLGHLAFHLNAGAVKPREFPNLNDYVTAMLDQEARAFIRSWNDALDAAVQQNNGKSLSPQQVAYFMLNMRYRFAFLTALLKTSRTRRQSRLL